MDPLHEPPTSPPLHEHSTSGVANLPNDAEHQPLGANALDKQLASKDASVVTKEFAKPTQLTDEERERQLRQFQYEKTHSNDYWGGHKGAVSGPAKDPFKLFRWAARKMSGDEDPSRRPPGAPEKWYDRSRSLGGHADDGAVGAGDMDTSKIA